MFHAGFWFYKYHKNRKTTFTIEIHLSFYNSMAFPGLKITIWRFFMTVKILWMHDEMTSHMKLTVSQSHGCDFIQTSRELFFPTKPHISLLSVLIMWWLYWLWWWDYGGAESQASHLLQRLWVVRLDHTFVARPECSQDIKVAVHL